MDEALSLGAFMESWELFRDPALAGTVVGALLGWLGVYIVLGRMVFLSAALSQAAGLGVAMAFWLRARVGLDFAPLVTPTAGAILTTGMATGLLAANDARRGPGRDGLVGVVFLLGSAGTLAIGTRIAADLHDIQSLLFGSAVAVAPQDLHALALTALVLLAVHAWWGRGFILTTLDSDSARVRGVPTTLLKIVLFATLAVAFSVCTRRIGALPVFALSVIPPFAALRISPNVNNALWIAALVGAFAGFAGYVAAYLFRLPVGPAQALVALVILGMVHGVSSLWSLAVPGGPGRPRSP
jgi:zinc transport system permease protein